MSPRLPLLLALVALVGLGACDSGDAIDAPTAADVAGVYTFDAFTFAPTATALAPVSVLDTLVAAESFVELLDGGQATLRFRRTGGTTRFVPGDFEVRRAELRVTFDSGNDDTLGRLILPSVLTFERDGDDALTLTDQFTADLEGYDAQRYSGFDAVPGTLTLRLTRQP
ncbi:hypothetical protein [Rubrivirga sp. IMCC45206]|uniref:hypothetical protein n=1 Tax=Rubrivirga sp. IMCC45206 TaxID=3391614 RepID=UPI0039902A96